MRKNLIRILCLNLIITLLFNNSIKPSTFESNLSSGWFPHNKEKLKSNIEDLFIQAKQYFDCEVKSPSIKALFVPHAGYEYSGICAASAYRKLLNNNLKNNLINKVIILAPCHFYNLDGIIIPHFEKYKTPLGTIEVNNEAIKTLSTYDIFINNRDAFKEEHSFKIQIPFLQYSISNFTIIPLLVGNLSDSNKDIALKALSKIIDKKTLIVVTSDLTHYGKDYNYEKFNKNILYRIKQQDSEILKAILNQSQKEFKEAIASTHANICGKYPVKLFLDLIKSKILKDLSPRLVCYYNSSQLKNAKQNALSFLENIPDNKIQNCVSYASIIFTNQPLKSLPDEYKFTNYEKLELLNLSKNIIANSLNNKNKINELLFLPILTPALLEARGVFVTLKTNDGQLRGCMGKITSPNSLIETVINMSKASAFEDSRFLSVRLNEVQKLTYEISILSKPKDIKSYKDIILGKHGIILTKDDGFGFTYSAVFLPQVPIEFGWDIKTTLSQLSKKAGLSKDAWKDWCRFQVFTSFSIKE